MKKKLTIVLISITFMAAIFLSWAIGVAVGQKNGGLNGEYNRVVNAAIYLHYMNEDRPEAAKNWMKGTIQNGVETMKRDEHVSLVDWFKVYLKYNERPPFTDSLKPIIDDAVENYEPKVIDLSKYKVTETETGFDVEIPMKDLEEFSNESKDAD